MLIYNEPEAVYRSQPHITFSRLKVAMQSLELYHRVFVKKLATYSEPTPAMVRGTAAHAMILEGQEAFESRFVVIPDKIRRGTKAWEAYEAADGGREGIKTSDYAALSAMSLSLEENDAAYALVSESAREVTARHQPSETPAYSRFGLQGRLDLLHPVRKVGDLKITDDFAKRHRLIADRNYVGQLAYYAWLASDDLEPEFQDGSVVFIEGVEPFRCQLVIVPATTLEMAHVRNLAALSKLEQAYQTGEWKETPNEAAWDVPNWFLDNAQLTGISE